MTFLVKKIMTYITKQLTKKINDADAIVIGAGAGLSSAAGFEYGGKYFLENFADINKNTDIPTCIQLGFIIFLL